MSNDTDPIIRTTQVALEQRKVGAALEVSRQASLSVRPDVLADRLLMQLESYVLAEKLVGDTKTVTGAIDFPSSPWQFYKQRHAESWWLRWLVNRRPVRTTAHRYERYVTFERYAHYPRSTLRVPELGRAVIFEQFTEPWRY